MAKDPKKKAEGNDKFYSKLLIHKKTRASLGMLVLVAMALVAVMLNQGMVAHLSWATIGLPICFGLCAFILYPDTEEWEYQAWQAKPQRYEQHFKN